MQNPPKLRPESLPRALLISFITIYTISIIFRSIHVASFSFSRSVLLSNSAWCAPGLCCYDEKFPLAALSLSSIPSPRILWTVSSPSYSEAAVAVGAVICTTWLSNSAHVCNSCRVKLLPVLALSCKKCIFPFLHVGSSFFLVVKLPTISLKAAFSSVLNLVTSSWDSAHLSAINIRSKWALILL